MIGSSIYRYFNRGRPFVERYKIGISACLLGRNVRYDGGHRYDDELIEALNPCCEWVPVCPEVEYGLPVPREAMRLTGDPAAPRLVVIATGIDHTEGMLAWAAGRLVTLRKDGLCGFIFKSRSPSSGMAGVKVYDREGNVVGTSAGLFAATLMRAFPDLPVEEDELLRDRNAREAFLARVRAYRRDRAAR
jgi:uncharacterized protein YbbK (DUF523 family)